ncbi:RDD family protein [Streptomyces sp. TLI_146]|uniref:RDD family protein n=1 Tax=Streptomyces sp. TLI_146 TaxID=1938858 RepID=UPI000C702E8E|nr:RDD family protein [Streptomyces sp. TLI_146]PKV85967.1 putative RDD family membrane protein YckC [Streptomyces sp. TLI_146]
MSAPTPATGDGTPAAGFYPDPSIPGYVRYWNGAAWVPGTSRPAPAEGETMPAPPAGAAPAAPALASAPPTPMPSPAPAVEETGPVFLDEPDPAPLHGSRPDPAPAWQADASHQSGFGDDAARRVSWGQPGDPAPGQTPQPLPAQPLPAQPEAGRPQPLPLPAGSASERAGAAVPLPADPAPVPPGQGFGRAPAGAPVPVQSLPAQPLPGRQRPEDPRVGGDPRVADPRRGEPQGSPAAVQPAPARAALPSAPIAPQSAPVPQQHSVPQQPAPVQQQAPQQAAAPSSPVTTGSGGGSASWAQQVHQLARPEERPGPGEPVVPWKPPVEDPFLRAARAQAAARPAGLGRRLAARLVDTLVLGGAVGGLALPLWIKGADHIQEKIDAAKLSGETVTVYLLDGTTGGYLALVLGAFLLLGVVYEALPTAKWGRTLGKRLLRVQVRDIESHEPPAFGAALRRWLVYGVLGVLAVGVVNVVWCLFDRPWRQCWHDKAARTFVAGT